MGKGDSRAPTTDVQQAPFRAPKRRSLGARLRPNTPTAGCASAWVDTPTLGDSTPTLGESIIASPRKSRKVAAAARRAGVAQMANYNLINECISDSDCKVRPARTRGLFGTEIGFAVTTRSSQVTTSIPR